MTRSSVERRTHRRRRTRVAIALLALAAQLVLFCGLSTIILLTCFEYASVLAGTREMLRAHLFFAPVAFVALPVTLGVWTTLGLGHVPRGVARGAVATLLAFLLLGNSLLVAGSQWAGPGALPSPEIAGRFVALGVIIVVSWWATPVARLLHALFNRLRRDGMRWRRRWRRRRRAVA
ncbi:MAG: hypothetical protein HKN62_03960 [Phycisphaerales bacterium]|nr:hypothetical protein [Phycisphaerales bacterium]